ncbi:hypothetical protein DENSPDRAFT_313634 [Dentipellis sp. KUC8613]|nr:hypothetical protein DENSPDRAFT_313634 [Dentipellis sp. KUC8613]
MVDLTRFGPSPVQSDSESFWMSSAHSRIRVLEQYSTTEFPRDRVVRDRWDRELTAAHAAFIAMRYSRNKIAPINTLPPEILVRVFQELNLSPGKHRRRHSGGSSSTLGWMIVTHVCHHWRQVALSTPLLWKKICFTLGADCTKQMLLRSRQAPIVFEQHYSNPTFDIKPDVPTIVQLIPRTQVLSLKAGSEPLKSLIPALRDSAPLLESLELHSVKAMRNEENTGALTLPQGIFASSTPRLRRLVLYDIGLPWPSPVLNGLTHLEVRFSESNKERDTHNDTERANSLLDSLAKLGPSLETLILVHHHVTVSMGEEPTVPLPHLRQLSLEGKPADCHRLLSLLEFPSTTDVEFTCHSDKLTGSDCYPLISMFSNLNGGCASNTKPLMKITCWEKLGKAFTLEASHNSKVIAEGIAAQNSANIRFRVCRRRFTIDKALGLNFFKMICAVLDIHSVQYLSLHLSGRITCLDWRAIDRLFPELVEIELCSEPSTSSMFDALSQPWTRPRSCFVHDTHDDEEVHFLRLRSLICEDFSFVLMIDDEKWIPSLGAMLPDMLKGRQESSTPLKQIVLKNCVFDLEGLESLREVVPVVTQGWSNRWTGVGSRSSVSEGQVPEDLGTEVNDDETDLEQ